MINLHKFSPSVRSHALSVHTTYQKSYCWTIAETLPFDELLISWNAKRPLKGHYVILSRVSIQNQWSPWLLYAVWSSHNQYSFHDITYQAPVHSFQDQVEILDGQTATGFCIRIEACQGATLDDFHDLYTCTSLLKSFQSCSSSSSSSLSPLPVSGLSQLCLNHPRATSFCSPTSTTALIHYILNHSLLDPLHFAQNVYDAGFDIYGNWSFNMAQACVELNFQWHCFCARATGFEDIENYLKKGWPVIVSVKGFLPGSLQPYAHGHLLVVKGYEVFTRQILCMDPAFRSNQETSVAYPWEAFMQAWANRRYLAYFFFPRLNTKNNLFDR